MPTDEGYVYKCIQCDVEVEIYPDTENAMRGQCAECEAVMHFNPRVFEEKPGPTWGFYRTTEDAARL